jgi:hypothetical protein
MPHLTLRDVDPRVKAALEARAQAEGLSQAEAARRALARGLGVRLPRRNLRGLGAAMFGPAALDALAQVDWTAPSFTDVELDALERAEAARCGAEPSARAGA